MSTKSNWGGRRPGAGSGGARPGAGRPKTVAQMYFSVGKAVWVNNGEWQEWKVTAVDNFCATLELDGRKMILYGTGSGCAMSVVGCDDRPAIQTAEGSYVCNSCDNFWSSVNGERDKDGRPVLTGNMDW